MAYDETLAGQVRTALGARSGLGEIKMFGGLCFTLNGNMACGVAKDALMIRVGADQYEALLAHPETRAMDFTGRPMTGMLYVRPEAAADPARLAHWVALAADFAQSLPPKARKPGRAKAKKASGPKTASAAHGTARSTVRAKTPAGRRKPAARGEPPAFAGFGKETLAFLRGLSAHNEKPWFEAHRTDYDAHYVQPALAFIAALGPRLRKIAPTIQYEPRINGSLFRINRDVRFSKDKTPYKDHLDLWFWEGDRKGWSHPGFYFRLTAQGLILGGGCHHWDKPALAAYREAVVDARRGAQLRKVLDGILASGPYTLGGAARKTVPQGYDKAHPRADLLLHEGLFLAYDGPHPAELSSSAFVDWCAGHCAAFAPLHRWLLKLAEV